MPIYEYGCSECGKHIEAFQKISDEPLSVCPECGGELSKLMSSTSFVLKGGGWYADGYTSSSSDKGKIKSDEPSPAAANGASAKKPDKAATKVPASKAKK